MSEGKQEILDEQEIEALNKRQSIPAIKMLRGRLGLGLREAKGITDKYRREHNLLTDFEKDERKIAVHDQLVKALKLHCIICVKMSGYKKEWCDSCVTTKALKAAGEEV